MFRILRRKLCTNIQILAALFILFVAPIYLTFEHSSMECRRSTQRLGQSWSRALDERLLEINRLREERDDLREVIHNLESDRENRVVSVNTQSPTDFYDSFRRDVDTDQGFIPRLSAAISNAERLMRSKIQLASRNTWKNTTSARHVLKDSLADMADIRKNLVHELNLEKIKNVINQQTNEDDNHTPVDVLHTMIQTVYSTLLNLQNPTKCYKARRLICDLNKSCGFACQIHHVAYCLVVACALERTLDVQDSTWSYAPGGWERFFLPWSDTCQHTWSPSGPTRQLQARPWDNYSMKSDYLHCPPMETLHRHPDFLPPAIPKNIADPVSRFHNNPFLWWMGQIIAFLMRPSSELRAAIEETMHRVGFWGPIVGIHIQRGSKQREDPGFYPVTSYFRYAEEYFRLLRQKDKLVKSRVYLATDSREALVAAKQSYPDFEILHVPEHVDLAAGGARDSAQSLRALLIDVFLLANSDLLVCTLSSQISRLAFELLQTYHQDGSLRVISLDQEYHFGGQFRGEYIATHAHIAGNITELGLVVDDHVIVEEKRGGYYFGMNAKTGHFGLFPSYKVKETVKSVDFPRYKEWSAVR